MKEIEDDILNQLKSAVPDLETYEAYYRGVDLDISLRLLLANLEHLDPIQKKELMLFCLALAKLVLEKTTQKISKQLLDAEHKIANLELDTNFTDEQY